MVDARQWVLRKASVRAADLQKFSQEELEEVVLRCSQEHLNPAPLIQDYETAMRLLAHPFSPGRAVTRSSRQ